MKSGWTVYQKLREAKFRHLVRLYKKYLKRAPANCKYNFEFKMEDPEGTPVTIRLCMLHQDQSTLKPNLLAICQQQSHCIKCNAFIEKYTKEDVKKILEKELNDKKIRESKYPDICALEWVLERNGKAKSANLIMVLFYIIKKFFKKGLF